MKPSLLPGDDPRDVLRLVDVTEVAADVGGVLPLLVEPAAVQEGDVLVLAGLLEDVGIEVPERGREQQGRPVEVDHALHRLLDGHGLRDHLLLADLDAGELGQRRRALGVRLVVAVVGLRPHVDEADGERPGGRRPTIAVAAADDGEDEDERANEGDLGREPACKPAKF
jgi:hypothetical protein